jgi:hypothetical protein
MTILPFNFQDNSNKKAGQVYDQDRQLQTPDEGSHVYSLGKIANTNTTQKVTSPSEKALKDSQKLFEKFNETQELIEEEEDFFQDENTDDFGYGEDDKEEAPFVEEKSKIAATIIETNTTEAASQEKEAEIIAKKVNEIRKEIVEVPIKGNPKEIATDSIEMQIAKKRENLILEEIKTKSEEVKTKSEEAKTKSEEAKTKSQKEYVSHEIDSIGTGLIGTINKDLQSQGIETKNDHFIEKKYQKLRKKLGRNPNEKEYRNMGKQILRAGIRAGIFTKNGKRLTDEDFDQLYKLFKSSFKEFFLSLNSQNLNEKDDGKYKYERKESFSAKPIVLDSVSRSGLDKSDDIKNVKIIELEIELFKETLKILNQKYREGKEAFEQEIKLLDNKHVMLMKMINSEEIKKNAIKLENVSREIILHSISIGVA